MAEPEPRIGSLCTGYGGLDAAVTQVLGGSLAWVADPDPGAAAILAHHHPDTPNLGDITTTDWATVEPVDAVCAGYPCQPFSVAGQRKGTADARHIWPFIATALRVLRPRLCVLENVAGHLRLGFDTVLADLAELGFDAEWCTVRASEVGAPHRRERLFVVATAQDADGAARDQRRLPAPGQASGWGARPDAGGRGGASAPDAAGVRHGHTRTPRLPGVAPAPVGGGAATAADTHRDGQQGVQRGEPGVGTRGDTDRRGKERWGRYGPPVARWEAATGRAAPWAVDVRGRLSPAFVEWLMGLPAGHVTSVPGLTRTAQLKALGNGVVPQQAEAAIRLLLDRATASAAPAA